MPDSRIGKNLADALNRDCHCIAVDRPALHRTLGNHLRGSGLPERLLDEHSDLFADSPVFLWGGHIEIMQSVIDAVERISRTPSYRDLVLSRAPPDARRDFGPRGVFYGYDFHLGANGPRLIEINTNAGGALLNLYLAAAQQACCPGVITFFGGKVDFGDVEDELLAMFRNEWRLQYPELALRTIAIVDEKPTGQFLYPELVLFQSLFSRHGINALIADPADFSLRSDGLWIGDEKVDLVYNRLTDFYLQSPAAKQLLDAYRRGLVVLTPSPFHYGLHADKRNLAILSDPNQLRALGIDEALIDTLSQTLPPTVVVGEHIADQLWKDRKQLFFKPVSGFGSRGAYRGAKMTRRVWHDIVKSDYVAQAIVPPSERKLMISGEERSLKLDIRCVSYDGRIQQLSARLYRGQTTNLRTEGGGLATVFATPGGSS